MAPKRFPVVCFAAKCLFQVEMVGRLQDGKHRIDQSNVKSNGIVCNNEWDHFGSYTCN